MRFMMMVKADKDYEAGAPPRPELMAAVGKLSRFMKVHADVLGPEYQGELEIRQLFDPADGR